MILTGSDPAEKNSKKSGSSPSENWFRSSKIPQQKKDPDLGVQTISESGFDQNGCIRIWPRYPAPDLTQIPGSGSDVGPATDATLYVTPSQHPQCSRTKITSYETFSVRVSLPFFYLSLYFFLQFCVLLIKLFCKYYGCWIYRFRPIM